MSNEIYIASTTTTDRLNIVSILLKYALIELNDKLNISVNKKVLSEIII